MSSNRLLFSFALAVLVAAASAKFQTMLQMTNALVDSEYALSFKKDGLVFPIAKGIIFENLLPPRNRLFALPDVNVAITRAFQKPGAVIPMHTHPRASENYAMIKGTLRLTIKLEGLPAVRNITTMLPPGHVTSIPQGLPHTSICVSKEECVYHIFFNNADPGFAQA